MNNLGGEQAESSDQDHSTTEPIQEPPVLIQNPSSLEDVGEGNEPNSALQTTSEVKPKEDSKIALPVEQEESNAKPGSEKPDDSQTLKVTSPGDSQKSLVETEKEASSPLVDSKEIKADDSGGKITPETLPDSSNEELETPTEQKTQILAETEQPASSEFKPESQGPTAVQSEPLGGHQGVSAVPSENESKEDKCANNEFQQRIIQAMIKYQRMQQNKRKDMATERNQLVASRIQGLEKQLETTTLQLNESRNRQIELLKKIDELERMILEREKSKIIDSLSSERALPERDIDLVEKYKNNLKATASGLKDIQRAEARKAALTRTMDRTEAIVHESVVVQKRRKVVIVDPGDCFPTTLAVPSLLSEEKPVVDAANEVNGIEKMTDEDQPPPVEEAPDEESQGCGTIQGGEIREQDGGSASGLNEEIIWCSIIMSIIIAILITMALCYLAREKCKKRNEYLAYA